MELIRQSLVRRETRVTKATREIQALTPQFRAPRATKAIREIQVTPELIRRCRDLLEKMARALMRLQSAMVSLAQRLNGSIALSDLRVRKGQRVQRLQFPVPQAPIVLSPHVLAPTH